MTVGTLERGQPMPGKKPDKRRAKEPPVRFEIRIDPAQLARIQSQADRRGISVSDYFRQAALLQVEKDEASSQTEGDAE